MWAVWLGCLGYPAAREDHKAALVRGPLGDGDHPAKYLLTPAHEPARKGAIGPHLADAREAGRHCGEQHRRTLGIRDVRGEDADHQQQPEGVDQDAPLASGDFSCPRRSPARHRLRWS
jgi:hypothetical protein